MKIHVLLFAAARDAVGEASLEMEIPPQSAVGQVLEELWRRYPALAPLRGALRLAVNEDFVESDHVLDEGDQVALLPPVSGG
jgi:molybdopterin converting factor subunit 1